MVCIRGMVGRDYNRNTNLSLFHDGCVKLLQWIRKRKEILSQC